MSNKGFVTKYLGNSPVASMKKDSQFSSLVYELTYKSLLHAVFYSFGSFGLFLFFFSSFVHTFFPPIYKFEFFSISPRYNVPSVLLILSPWIMGEFLFVCSSVLHAFSAHSTPCSAFLDPSEVILVLSEALLVCFKAPPPLEAPLLKT